MPDWKIKTLFKTRGPASLFEPALGLEIEPGGEPAPGFLTVDIYPAHRPKYPARHFGAWQFPFDEIRSGGGLALTVDAGGASLSLDGNALAPSKVIGGKLKEDGSYTVYLVLAEKGTYKKIFETSYLRLLSFSGAALDPAKHWPEEARRSPATNQPEFWMMKTLRDAVEKFAAETPPGSAVLDFGGGCAPYYPYFAARGAKYTNADADDGQFVDVKCLPGEALPVEDGSFDAVLCTHVLEHVPQPHETVAELYRVLKKGGRLLAGTPFAWESHHEPRDFWRFGRDGLNRLFAQFRDVTIQPDANASQALIMLRNCHIFRSRKNGFIRDALIRWGNFRCRTSAARCGDKSLTCNFIITAVK